MTQAEFVQRWKHQLLGIALDAAISRRTGAELALFLEHTVHAKVNAILAKMYEELTAKPEPKK